MTFMSTSKRFKTVALATLLVLAAAAAAFAVYRHFLLAATVNGSPISRLSIIQQLEGKSGSNALRQLIDEQLINEAATRAGIVVSRSDVDADIESYKTRLRWQGATLNDVLVQLEPGGMSEATFRERTAQRLRLQMLLDKTLGARMAVTEDDVDSEIRSSTTPLFSGMPPAEVRLQVMSMLRGRKLASEVDKWMAEARAAADVRLHAWYAIASPGAKQ